jgi:hypothetical protein
LPATGRLLRSHLNLFFFSLRFNDLKLASLIIASLRLFALHFLINLTGSRLLVYFPPFPAWCDFTRLAKSFVHPV